jgi:putative ferrous iron transport protein C
VILAELKGYLEARGQATLADMALHFRSQPEAVRDMLAIWERKGRVRRIPAPAGCGGSCTQCDPAATEVYLWVTDGGLDLPVIQGCSRTR